MGTTPTARDNGGVSVPTLTPDALSALTPQQLRARRTAKWTAYPPDVLAMWVAEMDFPLAAPVRQALHRAVDAETLGYPMDPAKSGLPQAYVRWAADRYGWSVDPDRVFVVPDVMHGVQLALTQLTQPTDPVVVTTPVYMPFFDIVELSGRPQVRVPMATDEQGRATFDLEALDAAFAAGARTLLLCSPYNPLGRAFSRAELDALAQVVQRHDVRVISDEIHAPLVLDGVRHIPFASLSPDTAGRTVTVTAASKAWNLPGLRCAQVVLSNEPDAQVWRALSHWQTGSPSTLGVEATIAAFEQGRDWLDEVLAQLEANRAVVRQRVAQWPGVRLGSTEATYLAWLDLTGLELTEEPSQWLLRQARVALSPGRPFGAEPNGFARLNYATTPQILTEALDRIEHAVRERHATVTGTPV